MEFRDAKVVHKTLYFADPFEAPARRKQWVQQRSRNAALQSERKKSRTSCCSRFVSRLKCSTTLLASLPLLR